MDRFEKIIKTLEYDYRGLKIVVKHKKNITKNSITISCPDKNIRNRRIDATKRRKENYDIKEHVIHVINRYEDKIDKKLGLENDINNTFQHLIEEKNAKIKKPLWKKILCKIKSST